MGTLEKIEELDGEIIVYISRHKIMLPQTIKEKLKECERERIAILRTDIHGKEYLIRKGE